MAKRIKGITIELDGETKGLDKALGNVNQRSRDLQTELRDVDKLLKFSPDSIELIDQKQKLLGEQVETTREKLNKLKDAEIDVQRQFENGDIGEKQYRDFQREIVESESKLATFETKLKSTQTEAKTLGDNLKETGEKLKSVGDKTKDIGGSLSAKVTAPLIAGFGLASKGTEALREDLAKLDTNAENAGISTETINGQLERLSGISTETDTNVEALSNLLATGFDEQGMTEAMDALSGAAIKFPDTMKLEGMADGLQETISTGKAIGPFAEILERMGVDLEAFDEGLAKAAESGDEQNYVLEQLANTGLADVNEKYRENNEEIIKSNESTANFQKAIADLGEKIAPVLTKATEVVTMLLNKLGELSPTMQNVILVVAGIAAAIGPVLVVGGQLISSVGSIMTILPKLSAAFTLLTGPIGLIIAAVVALIAIGVLLYKNWDTISAKAIEIWGFIKEFLVETWGSIKEIAVNVWESIKTFFLETWESIKTVFISALEKVEQFLLSYWSNMEEGTREVWEGIKTFFSGVWDLIKNIFVGAFLVLLQLVTGQWGEARKSTEQIWDNIKEALRKVWEGIKGIFSGALKVIFGFVKTYWDNIKSLTSTVWGSIKNFISTTLEKIKTFISTKFQDMKNSVTEKMGDIKDSISNIWGNVMDFFTNIDLRQIGIDIIQGLIGGIASMATAVVDSAKGVVNGAISGAKRLLGIASPSKVFTKMGEQTGEGLEGGMKAMGRRVSKAGEKMVAMSIPEQSGTSRAESEPFKTESPQPIIIQNMSVRNDNDIKLIARELERLKVSGRRAIGGMA